MENRETRPAGMRQSNLELFRIITMLFILAHHYVVHSGLLSYGPVDQAPLSLHGQFILLFGAWGKIGINCFILFSGYFMCKQEITLRKFLKLFCEILFYRIAAVLLITVTGYEKLSFAELADYLLPIRDLNADFYCGYLVFFLFIPFLNSLVRHMNERTHVRLIALVSFVCVFMATVPGFSVTLNNSIWFMALYIISSYIRLYPKKIFDNRRFWTAAALGCFILCALSVVVCSRLHDAFGKDIRFAYHFVMDSNVLLAAVMSICAFLCFKNLRIPQNRMINTIASTTFGVLLVHANGHAVTRWLWTDLLHTLSSHETSFGYVHALLCVPAVFIVASCIDLLRIRFAEKPFFRFLDRILPGIVVRWQRFEEKFFKKCHIQ